MYLTTSADILQADIIGRRPSRSQRTSVHVRSRLQNSGVGPFRSIVSHAAMAAQFVAQRRLPAVEPRLGSRMRAGLVAHRHLRCVHTRTLLITIPGAGRGRGCLVDPGQGRRLRRVPRVRPEIFPVPSAASVRRTGRRTPLIYCGWPARIRRSAAQYRAHRRCVRPDCGVPGASVVTRVRGTRR